MTFASEPFSSAPFSAESGTNAAYSATSIAPLFKFGSHVGKVNILAPANSIAPLLKYGSHTGSIHWTPVDLTARAFPVYPLLKFGTPEQVLPLVASSTGPLLKFARHAAILGKKTGMANPVAPLLKFGAPSAVFSTQYPAASVAPLFKFGSLVGKPGTIGQAGSIGPLFKFGTPSGPYQRRAKGIHVLTVKQVVYVQRRKAA